MVESYAALKAPIDGEQIRAIAGNGETRSPMQPNVPTLRESDIAAEVVGWNSLVAPARRRRRSSRRSTATSAPS